MAKIIVIQIGARHHYAIPRMLEHSGYLDRLYTDSCANKGLGLWCKKYLPRKYQPGDIKNLTQREIQGVPHEKIYTTDILLIELLRQKFFPRDTFDHQIILGQRFSNQLIKWGIGDAEWIYSLFGEGYDYLGYAKRMGLKIAIDIFANPITHKIYRAERDKYPEWEMQYHESYDCKVEKHVDKIIALADLLICPSKAVVDGLRVYPTFREEKIRVVPYGSGIQTHGTRTQPIVGRILFAGSANLGKGIQYYSQAAMLLLARGNNYEFYVAGRVTETVRSRPECKFLNFLGRIPRKQMVHEYQRADVFVLPTLAEGSASVVSEALAFGLPVITTLSAGSLIEDGIDGLIVPERDSQALADAIQRVVENRSLRERLAQSARNAILKYSEEAWEERLVKVFEDHES